MVVVASVGCTTQPVGAHILRLPHLSGDIDEYAWGGWVDSQPGSVVSVDSGDRGAWCTCNDIDECEGDCADRICIVGVFCANLCSCWTFLR